MWNWENNLDKKYGMPYSRYIASWINVGGKIKHHGEFWDWLEALELDAEDIRNIVLMGTNGKLEFECNARNFLHNLHKDES